jgi:Fic family protein
LTREIDIFDTKNISVAKIQRKEQLLQLIWENPGIQVSGIQLLLPDISLSTINRDLKALIEDGKLVISGTGRSTSYSVVQGHKYLHSGIGDSYFDKDIDDRRGNKRINTELFTELSGISIFTPAELAKLNGLQAVHLEKINTLSPALRQKENERLSIELSWKSSQIEGNTYSLLETEVLIEQHIPAEGKTNDEALMLLNHKTALDYLFDHRISLSPLQVASIENIHRLLLEGLGVSRNIRTRIIGITGTSYTPPDNQHQIREYLELSCQLINERTNIFEKALLAVLLISYIQPFEDGNKRTGRIMGNGLLIENGYCPLSYRSVKPIDYKKAMILFYEQNNISLYKQLFIEQFEYAVNNYYR